MRPPWWRHYKINMAFHFGERLIIIVNSGGLISPRREWDERVQVNGNHARWDGVNRRDVEDWGFGTKNWVGHEKLNSHWTWGTIAVVCDHLWLGIAFGWTDADVLEELAVGLVIENGLRSWVRSFDCIPSLVEIEKRVGFEVFVECWSEGLG